MFNQIGARLSAMMFIQFFIWGAWFVTVGNFMEAALLSKKTIGNAYSVGPIAAIISPFFLGMVADRFFATERVLGILHILGGVLIYLTPSFVSPDDPAGWLFLAFLLGHNLCYMPTIGLVNTLAFHNLENPEKQFPLIRVFGTLGWIVAGLYVSWWLGADKEATPFRVAGYASILMGFYSFTLPHTPPPDKGKKVALRDILCLDALSLLKERSYLVFIVCSFLVCIPLSTYYAFAPVFVNAVELQHHYKEAGVQTEGQVEILLTEDEAAFDTKPATYMSFGQMSEVFFMLVMPFFFRKLGVKWMLAVGMLAWVLRYALFSLGAPDAVLGMVLVGILLHGVCYDFFFVTGYIYADKKAPKPIRAQAQGFLVLVTLGLGMFIGAQISGKMAEHFITVSLAEGQARLTINQVAEVLPQWKQFWAIPSIGAGVIMVLFAFLFNDKVDRTEIPEEEQIAV